MLYSFSPSLFLSSSLFSHFSLFLSQRSHSTSLSLSVPLIVPLSLFLQRGSVGLSGQGCWPWAMLKAGEGVHPIILPCNQTQGRSVKCLCFHTPRSQTTLNAHNGDRTFPIQLEMFSICIIEIYLIKKQQHSIVVT